MAFNVATIWQDIADRINLVGVRCESFVQDSPNVPCVVAYPVAFPYGNGTLERPFPTFRLLLLGGTVDNRSAQKILNEWISEGTDTSVVDAVQDGGQFAVTDLVSYGTVTTVEGGVRYFSAELDILVYS